MATPEQEKSSGQSKGKSEKANGGIAENEALNAIKLLKADHRKVEELFSQYEQARRRQEKAKIAQNICRELIIHAEIEEEIFYPACRAYVEDNMLDEAQVEHDGAKILISEIASGSPSDEFYDAKVKVLSEYIRHHVQEEEKRADSIFEQAKSGGLDMEEIGEQMQARKQELQQQMQKELALPQPVTLDVIIGEEEEEVEEVAQGSRRGRHEEEEERRGRRMPERDEYGRFASDEESEGGRGGGASGRGGFGGRGREEGAYRSQGGGRGQGMRGGQGYGENYSSRGGRGEDEQRGYGGEQRGAGGRGGYPEQGRGEQGRGERGGRAAGGGGQDYDERSYPRAGREDERRYGGGRDEDRNQGGWFGDPEGHSEAARRGWEHRR